MKFDIGDLCLTCNMVNPSENGLEAEITGVGVSFRTGGVHPRNISLGCDYEVFIPALVDHTANRHDSSKYGLYDMPEFRLKKLPPGDTPAQFDQDIWIPDCICN